MSLKKKVAVLFGGRSPEHDVSVVTGLQVLKALDPDLYDAFPVYLAINGEWLVGDRLRDRAFYIPPSGSRDVEPVGLRFRTTNGAPALVSKPGSIFRQPGILGVDVAIPAFHGVGGEDGAIQGLLEIAGIPYCGMRALASAVFMDKVATKHMLAATGVPLLPYAVIHRPDRGRLILPKDLAAQYPGTEFPCCVKPVNLGSSIGVAKVNDWEELSATLPQIFLFDKAAILEPFVQNLVEYNVAVSRLDGAVRTSAIERPKHASELLDFKAKYLSGGNKGDGKKLPQQSSEGMLSLTRDINPVLPEEMEKNIRQWATAAFQCVGGTGAPRIDFLCDSATGEIWLNEVNACPGSFGYFLWEAAAHPINFSSLLDSLIAEGERCYAASELPADPIPEQARLFSRKVR
jgi:D-alanine-D-alanine ligase